jgi:hypothetical protein
LFLGGYYALAHIDDLGITHVLSVVNGPISRNMCIEILGSDSEEVSAAGRPLIRHHVSHDVRLKLMFAGDAANLPCSVA